MCVCVCVCVCVCACARVQERETDYSHNMVHTCILQVGGEEGYWGSVIRYMYMLIGNGGRIDLGIPAQSHLQVTAGLLQHCLPQHCLQIALSRT